MSNNNKSNTSERENIVFIISSHGAIVAVFFSIAVAKVVKTENPVGAIQELPLLALSIMAIAISNIKSG
jgi:hypothetical protein